MGLVAYHCIMLHNELYSSLSGHSRSWFVINTNLSPQSSLPGKHLGFNKRRNQADKRCQETAVKYQCVRVEYFTMEPLLEKLRKYVKLDFSPSWNHQMIVYVFMQSLQKSTHFAQKLSTCTLRTNCY